MPPDFRERAPLLTHPSGLVRSKWPLHIVSGAPCSGKSSYVKQHAQADDLIIDLDEIASRIAGSPLHRWPDDTLRPAIDARNMMLMNINDTQWHHVWFIVSEPVGVKRQWWHEQLGAEATIVMLTPAMECLRRLSLDATRLRYRTASAINDWWKRYSPSAVDASTFLA